jgi:hypothetical protein
VNQIVFFSIFLQVLTYGNVHNVLGHNEFPIYGDICELIDSVLKYDKNK